MKIVCRNGSPGAVEAVRQAERLPARGIWTPPASGTTLGR
mgnify:CR=1 FL=1